MLCVCSLRSLYERWQKRSRFKKKKKKKNEADEKQAKTSTWKIKRAAGGADVYDFEDDVMTRVRACVCHFLGRLRRWRVSCVLPSEFSFRTLSVYLFLWGESVSRAIWVFLNIVFMPKLPVRGQFVYK